MTISQRINFYQDSFHKPVVALPLKKLVVGWVVVISVLALYSVLDLVRTNQARTTLKKMEASASQLDSAVTRLQQEVDAIAVDPQLMHQEKQLRQSLQSKRQFVQQLQQQGETSDLYFSGYLHALSTLDAGPVWLTRIQIDAPGPEISLYGLTEKPKAIPRYVSLLKSDANFIGMRFKVFNLERDETNANYLTFNLSTRFDDADSK